MPTHEANQATPACRSYPGSLIIRLDEVDGGRRQRGRELEQRHDGRVPPTSLEVGYTLLREAGPLGELLLRQSALLARAAHVPPDELAHVHAQSIGCSAQQRLSTIVCTAPPFSMLELRTLLEAAAFDPAEVLVVRHTPVEKSLKRVLPW